MINDTLNLIYAVTIAGIGGVVGYFTKVRPTQTQTNLSKRLISLFVYTLSSMFAGYIVFLIVMHFTQSQQLASAAAGVGGFAGTDILVALQNKIIKIISDIGED